MGIMKAILKGLLEYRIRHRTDMAELIRKVRAGRKPQAVFYACMDTRMIPRQLTKSQIGDMTIVRNPGNIIPNARNYLDEWSGSEPAALEFACIMNHIKHVVVCGHSDCRAMNALYQLRNKGESDPVNIRESPLKTWLHVHAYSSLQLLLNMKGDYTKPITFMGVKPEEKMVAYIDPENKLKMEDKLSQMNTIQQIQNVTSYKMLKGLLEKQELYIHALWLEINDGDVYYFSRKAQRFIMINEKSYEAILSELKNPYSYKI